MPATDILKFLAHLTGPARQDTLTLKVQIAAGGTRLWETRLMMIEAFWEILAQRP